MKQIDRTVNRSGPSNMMPIMPIRPCAIQSLVDGFVKDKWIAPENRDHEVIAIYQSQLRVAHKRALELSDRREREGYAASWLDRFKDYHAL